MKARFILPLLLSGVAMAQPAGTFTATGGMTTARMAHSATLLPNGKVLIAGGSVVIDTVGSALASAELYDPATGAFTVTGNMTTPRSWHSATLLPDGKVLIAGGARDSGAELYDPSTGTFTATRNMTNSRGESRESAILLSNGKVLIADGGGWMIGANAELYDPLTGTFEPTGTPPVLYPYFYPANKALLPDGNVLFPAENRAELYDAASGAFRTTGPMISPYHFTATLLPNGKVLFTGGNDDPGDNDTAELYDPSTGLFTATGNMMARRANHTATLLPDGRVLIAGSEGNGGKTLAIAELYDPVMGTFSATGEMITDRGTATATLLKDGRVLIAGGVRRLSPDWSGVWAGGTLSSAELYNPLLLFPAPSLFSVSGDGQGQGAILHAGTSQLASAANPAKVGEALEIYCTGLGDGSSAIPPQVAIGGRTAEILWFGNAPGYAGLNQVNVRVPNGVAPGPAVSVRLNYIGRSSNEVTMSVR